MPTIQQMHPYPTPRLVLDRFEHSWRASSPTDVISPARCPETFHCVSILVCINNLDTSLHCCLLLSATSIAEASLPENFFYVLYACTSLAIHARGIRSRNYHVPSSVYILYHHQPTQQPRVFQPKKVKPPRPRSQEPPSLLTAQHIAPLGVPHPSSPSTTIHIHTVADNTATRCTSRRLVDAVSAQ